MITARIKPRPRLKAVVTRHSTGSGGDYQQGYDVGYEDGHANGYHHGYQEGTDAGYYAGYTKGEEAGYTYGYSQGKETGQLMEYDRFWDICQDNGTRTNYYYGFAYTSWSDGCFNPKYPITCKSASANAQAVFYNNTNITEIPCEVHIIGIVARNTFYGCKNLKSIALLYLEGNVSFSNTFSGCSALENLTVSGSISSSIDLSASSVLSNASVQSVIDCLATVSSQHTLTLHASVGANVTAEQKAAITAKNWELVY